MTHILKDVYQSVTNTIITAMESGTPPWVRPWSAGADSMCPSNLVSGRRYRGVNVLLLNLRAFQSGYSANHWMTYQQARSLGANVRRGESGTEVVLYKLLETEQPVPAAQGEARRVIPLIRSFTVFNAAQIDNLPGGLTPEPVATHAWEACEAAEAILSASGADIRHAGDRAFYSPLHDFIQLPERRAFPDATAYCQVALHEVTHWSAASNRCNRPLLGRQHIESYAFEELVAELGSAFLTDHCGMAGVLHHASYIESWLKALRNDKRLIFAAASQAQKACDYLLNLCPQCADPVQSPIAEAA